MIDSNVDIRSHEYIIAGTVSWGVGCANPASGGVYTKVSLFKQWISSLAPGAKFTTIMACDARDCNKEIPFK